MIRDDDVFVVGANRRGGFFVKFVKVSFEGISGIISGVMCGNSLCF